MTQSKEEFIKVFKFELKNLIEDISGLIEYEKALHDEEKHTNFVYLENLVVLKDEIMGLNGILGFIDELSEELPTEDFLEKIEKDIYRFVKSRGYPLAVNDLVQRRIRRIDEMKEFY